MQTNGISLARWCVAFALLLGAGCATVRVQTEATPGAAETAKNYRTYAWLPLHRGKDETHSPELGPLIEQTADRALSAKGYRRINEGTPDFLLGWHLSVEHTLDVQSANVYYGYRWSPVYFGPPYRGYGYGGFGYGGSGPVASVREYKQGTLVLDVVDASSDSLVWRGIAEGEVPSSVRDKADRVKEGVGHILDQFPPR